LRASYRIDSRGEAFRRLIRRTDRVAMRFRVKPRFHGANTC
jgi:hypothetical protein